MKNEILIEKDILIISNQTIIKLFSFENGSDLVALYMFYHKQCKIQGTNQSFTVGDFAKKGLKWGDKRFKKAKKILIELGLIENINQRDEKGKITGWFIKLNYIQNIKNTSGAKSYQVDEATSGGQEANALSKKDKMLKVKKINKDLDFEKIKTYKKNTSIIIPLYEIIKSDFVKQSFDNESFFNLYEYIIDIGKKYGYQNNETGIFKIDEFIMLLEKIKVCYENKEIKNFKSTFLNWISPNKK